MDPIPGYLSGIAAVLLLSAFVKVLTTLSIVRIGLGLQGLGFGVVIVALSLGLTALVMQPQLTALGGAGALFGGERHVSSDRIERQLTPFLEKHVDADVKKRFEKLALKLADSGKPVADDESGSEVPPTMGDNQQPSEPAVVSVSTEGNSQYVLIAAFLVSELKEAFQIGFIVLIPFLVLDLLVANILLALGVTQISQAVVALPFKILLFFAVDGWALISEKLIAGYL